MSPFRSPTSSDITVRPLSRVPSKGIGRARTAMPAASRLVGVLLLGASAASLAQSPGAYPTRPIRMVVAFAPGGPADIVARTVSPKLGELLGQPILIENRGGAGGTIGADVVAKSAPDGYTLTYASQSSYVFAPFLYSKLGYDSIKDTTPISSIVTTPNVVAINPRVPAKTVADLVRLGKGKTNFLTYGSSGSGATSHIGGELLGAATGLSLVHVPYKGTGPALAGVITGEIDMMIADLGPVVSMAKNGQVRILASFGAKRTSATPDVPTIAEAGYKIQPLEGRFGLMGPGGMSKELVTRLNSAMVQVTKMPDVRGRFDTLGYDTIGDTPEQYAQTIRTELEVFGKLIRKAGIKAE
jgi:tripartite-type tricarboxylate transporter receptor subunit TctC